VKTFSFVPNDELLENAARGIGRVATKRGKRETGAGGQTTRKAQTAEGSGAGTRTKAAKPKAAREEIEIPAAHDWRTTDEDEVNRRRLRAREEQFEIRNLDLRFELLSNFAVKSRSGMDYTVELRDVARREAVCDCADFRKSGLGACKHSEAVLLHLEGRYRKRLPELLRAATPRVEVVVDFVGNSLRVLPDAKGLPRAVRGWFDAEGRLTGAEAAEAVEALRRLAGADLPEIRVSQEVAPWLEARRRLAERKELRHEYEQRVQRGEWPAQETKVALFPYQREGMLHLAFTERGLLADEMGLGKTIQAIAACALLRRLGKAERVLVVTPASLKGEWEEQIQMFTDLPCRLVYGKQSERRAAYAAGTFFTVVNYEQMVADGLEVNARFRPDIVVLDEAQRIKNWSTKTAQAIKRLQSRYAFVLTGTPIENRIDELYSLMDFVDASALGPLFRFNRAFYDLDDRGRPQGYRNLEQLHAGIAPYMIRRRKSDVETELPSRTDRNHFVPLAEQQRSHYEEPEAEVTKLAFTLRRRPLTPREQERMMINLAKMRMICDSNYILDANDRECPKLVELESILAECRDNEDVKVIIFSEWERMLDLVRGLCRRRGMGFAWHTGSVPQQKRRAEIRMFKDDPACRVFLSTDSGATGLNLQNASVVINCDLPWNPAKLEQRIGRAWRKHQTRAVTVINLVAENTIEHRMLDTLAQKQALADGVLDQRGDYNEIKLKSGSQKLLAKLEQLVGTDLHKVVAKPVLPSDRALAFSAAAGRQLGGALLACEERYPREGEHTVLLLIVESSAATHRLGLEKLYAEYFADRDPLSPVQLEVIHRATHETIERLIAAGLIAPVTRAARPLYPQPEAGAPPAPLSPEERAAAQAQRERAARKLKMARLLAGGDLHEEARPPLLEAIFALARALAVEARRAEPETTEEALSVPHALVFGEHAAALAAFHAGLAEAQGPAEKAVGALLGC
jgi:superfamily II DNA or RNA helicase